MTNSEVTPVVSCCSLDGLGEQLGVVAVASEVVSVLDLLDWLTDGCYLDVEVKLGARTSIAVTEPELEAAGDLGADEADSRGEARDDLKADSECLLIVNDFDGHL